MSGLGWADAPPAVREQVESLVSGFRDLLGERLLGVYVYGSLALGCWNPFRSDVDLIVVTTSSLVSDERQAAARLFLDHSGPRGHAPPHPLDAFVVTTGAVDPWRHPAPFDLCYSESLRGAFERGDVGEPGRTSRDLAAELTIARRAGIAVHGPPAASVFPEIPKADYADALLADLVWCRTTERLDYVVLSASRVWATLTDGGLQSKDSGARWALEQAPARFRPLIADALAWYRGEARAELEEDAARTYLAFVEAQLRERVG